MIKAVYQIICGGWNLHKTGIQIVYTLLVLHKVEASLHVTSSY